LEGSFPVGDYPAVSYRDGFYVTSNQRNPVLWSS